MEWKVELKEKLVVNHRRSAERLLEIFDFQFILFQGIHMNTNVGKAILNFVSSNNNLRSAIKIYNKMVLKSFESKGRLDSFFQPLRQNETVFCLLNWLANRNSEHENLDCLANKQSSNHEFVKLAK